MADDEWIEGERSKFKSETKMDGYLRELTTSWFIVLEMEMTHRQYVSISKWRMWMDGYIVSTYRIDRWLVGGTGWRGPDEVKSDLMTRARGRWRSCLQFVIIYDRTWEINIFYLFR